MKFRNFLLNAILSIVASLPFGLLYLLSDFLYLVVYHIIGYRKKIVYDNVTKSFPDKNPKEIQRIIKQFYKNFCDVILEVIKSQKMLPSELEKRVHFTNRELFDHYFEKKKSVLASLGHCGNWEWVGNKIALFLKHDGGAVYKPVHDQFFDDYMIAQRQKYKNTLMIDYRKVFKTLVSLRNKLYTVFVLADQSPALHETDYFVTFLGRKTAFYNGMEKVARALDYAVIYLDIIRRKRGFYQVEVKVITDSAANTKTDEITLNYVSLLEESIIKQPDNWLWSHKRWKKNTEED
jgi:KDO2-lipid IV(A) lauroyltransferase